MTLTAGDFPAFFRAIHGDDPFPWQGMLAERVAQIGWPDALDLPTGSGKTACLDIGIFALACQADRPAAERTAARRIFFVVDRRIVVDAAFARALKIARALQKAREGVLGEVADALRRLHGERLPLFAARMRGGVTRDDGWMRSPAQPAIITGTVDQVGSRLLFRAYGPRLATAPIHAALVGNDSLILLDEAHCAVPFYQTASGVARYRRPDWATEPLPLPFNVVVMSATPPEGATDVWPGPAERTRALEHPKLDQRLQVPKGAELVLARIPKRPKKGEIGLRGDPVSDDDELVADAADRAIKAVAQGRRRIAIMVNRVRTARRIYQQLVAEVGSTTDALIADLVLLTGRMRPLDRDTVVGRWSADLNAAEIQPALDRAVIVVTTQCLEVGADYSFDGLITECASLDALRQRFGRLDRLGIIGDATAVILVRKSQVKNEEKLEKLDGEGKPDDPIYGNALARTWNWLSSVATEEDGRQVVDFGVAGLGHLLPKNEEERRTLLERLNAPAPDAPVLLPAHLDCWVQTAPPPNPDPDPAVFLHGPNRGEPEVSVVLRSDLLENNPEEWPEVASLSPPSSLEALSVPLRVIRAWIGDTSDVDPGGDVEGEVRGEDEGERQRGRRPVLIWKGRDRSKVTSHPKDIRPNQVLILPATPDAHGLGDFPRDGLIEDLGDAASYVARRRPRIRINGAVLKPWKDHPAVAALLEWSSTEEVEDDEVLSVLSGRLEAVATAGGEQEGGHADPLPDWLRKAAGYLTAPSRRQVPLKHPGGGWIVEARGRLPVEDPLAEAVEEETTADGDDLTSSSDVEVTLQSHLADVAVMAGQFATRCLPPPLHPVLQQASRMHDLGKADWRFQVMLHRGSEIEAYRTARLLAKSTDVPRSQVAAARARRLSGLPEGWRHEMLSLQLAERAAVDSEQRDLLLHLIASHHGHARPFAPVISDPDPGAVDLSTLPGAPAGLDAAARATLVPSHRLDSGVPERFWRLTRRYGWWGLAYLEASLRLADWKASGVEESAAGMAHQEPGVV